MNSDFLRITAHHTTQLKMRKLKQDVEKKVLKLSVTEDGKEGKSKMIDCVVWFLGGRAASMQQGRRGDDGRPCGDAWSGLENQSKEIGSKKSEKEEMQC